MIPDGFGLGPSQLPSQIRRQQRQGLLVAELSLALRSEVLLLEPETRPVEERLDRAFGHLQRLGDLAIAHVLELAQGQGEPVRLRPPLGHVPGLPAGRVGRVGLTAAVGPDELNVGRLAGACDDRCVPYFVHFIFRLRQATTAARVNNRSGSFRASWGSPPCSVSVTTDVTPKLFSASQPGPLLPVSRTTGTPAAWARLATSPGALPKAVCSSTRPSPVMTRSAPRSLASSPAASTTRGAPGTRLASRKATRPAPVPPAAPAPGMSATLLPRSRWMTAASRPSAASSSRTACASAPFCGP